MPVDQELSALATVASLLPTDIIYLVRDPGGVAEADHKAAVSVLDARYPGAVISVFGRTGAVVAASGDYSAGQISGLGTLAVLNSPLAIANGGSGQITQQAALDALSNVVAATNEHVLTKDTASGNVIFKAAAGGGSSLPVADTTSVVMGSADNTKLLRFEVDGFTAGATRVLTPPNQDATIAGLEVANIFTQPQTIQGALAVAPTTNAFGTSNVYTSFVVGNLTGATANNGGLYASARKNKANEPFVALSAWDDGTGRALYFGGGGWDSPDATDIYFYTAAAYNETNNAGILRLSIAGAGDVSAPLLRAGTLATTLSTTFPFVVYKAASTAYMQITTNGAGVTVNDGMFFGVSTSGAELWGGTGLDLILYAQLTQVAKFDKSTTAGNTRFLIYDVDNGQLERVTVGAADSGGVGFKVLRIPN